MTRADGVIAQAGTRGRPQIMSPILAPSANLLEHMFYAEQLRPARGSSGYESRQQT